MRKFLTVGVVSTVVITVVLVCLLNRNNAERPSGNSLGESPSQPVPQVPVLAVTPTAGDDRTPAGDFWNTLEPSTTSMVLTGRVLDIDGRPVAEAPVYFVQTHNPETPNEEASHSTDALGAFSIEIPDEPGIFIADSDLHVTVQPIFLPITSGEVDHVIRVGPRCIYAGVVVDENGDGLEGVDIEIHLGEEFLRRAAIGQVQRSRHRWNTVTDDRGNFELTSVGWTPGSYLVAEQLGFTSHVESLPPHSRSDCIITLVRESSGPAQVSGVVLDPQGHPVPRAWVSTGDATSRTNKEGQFDLSVPLAEEDILIQAVAKGFLPAAEILDLSDPEEVFVTLVLGDSPLSITGRVVDKAGRGISHARIWTSDTTTLGTARVQKVGSFYSRQASTIESIMAGANGGEADMHTYSGEGGRFELTGLIPRSYSVGCIHPQTMELTNQAIEAGASDALIVLPGAERTTRVAGRVVTYSGIPIANVTLAPRRSIALGDSGLSRSIFPNTEVTTDENGAFEFSALCFEKAALIVAGKTIGHVTYELDPSTMNLSDLELKAPARCQLQVALADEEEADSFTLLDATDKRLKFKIHYDGDRGIRAIVHDLRGGRSELITTDERARTLVLRKGGVDIRRIPLELTPGTLNVLNP